MGLALKAVMKLGRVGRGVQPRPQLAAALTTGHLCLVRRTCIQQKNNQLANALHCPSPARHCLRRPAQALWRRLTAGTSATVLSSPCRVS